MYSLKIKPGNEFIPLDKDRRYVVLRPGVSKGTWRVKRIDHRNEFGNVEKVMSEQEILSCLRYDLFD
jgi:hypothetical protein